MKKFIISLFTILVFASSPLFELKAQEQGMDPRIKALAMMAMYGTVGGALLGTASLAFDGEGRNIAKGASLGLYTGLLFGGYVVISHAVRKHKMMNPKPSENYYPDTTSPYENDYNGGGAYAPEQPQLHISKSIQWEELSPLKQDSLLKYGKSSKFVPTYYFPIINLSF